MISKTVINVCETGKIHLIENYDMAVSDENEMWECHHRLEVQDDGTELSSRELKERGLYWKRPPEELIFLRRKDHRKLHFKTNLYKIAKKKALNNRSGDRTNWIDMFRGKSKEEISAEIEKLDLTAHMKSRLRRDYVFNTPYTYRIKPKPKKQRTTHNWEEELSGKTEQECEEIINNTIMNVSQRSRLRKRFCPNFKRCEVGSKEWKEKVMKGLENRRLSHPPKTREKKGCKFSRKYSSMSRDELISIVLDDNTDSIIRKLICEKLLKVDYKDFNTKTKRLHNILKSNP